MVITIKNGWNTIAWTKTIHLEQHPYQQQSLKFFLILQGHKNSHRKILPTGTLSQIWNYYILEVWEKDCHLKKRYRHMCDNLKNFVIVYIQYSFEFLLLLHHIFQPILSVLPTDITGKNSNILTLEFKFSFKLLMSLKYSISRKKMLNFLGIYF